MHLSAAPKKTLSGVRLVLATVALCIAVPYLLLHALPFLLPAPTIRGWADQLVEAGQPYATRWLLAPLAMHGDAIAQNNLGVLLYRADRHGERAERWVRAAARQGLPRAKLNLVTLRYGRCQLNARNNIRAIISLRNLAALGDMTAASQLLDCAYFNDVRAGITDSTTMLADLADAILVHGSPELQLKAGWALLTFAATTEVPATEEASRPGGPYAKAVAPLAIRAHRLLLAAAAAGKDEAYEWLATARRSSNVMEHLDDDPLTEAVRNTSFARWRETAAAAGSWEAVCIIAEGRIWQVLNGDTSDAAYQEALERARDCTERQPAAYAAPPFEKIYLAYAPRTMGSQRPPPSWHSVRRMVEEMKFRETIERGR